MVFVNLVDLSAISSTRGFAVGSASGFYLGVGGVLVGVLGIG